MKLYYFCLYVCGCVLGLHAVPKGYKHAVLGRPDGRRRYRGLEFAQAHCTASSAHRWGAACPVSSYTTCITTHPLSMTM